MERILLTIPEVAMKLGLGRSLIYSLVKTGEIESLKIGRARRVPMKALTDYIEIRLSETERVQGRENDS